MLGTLPIGRACRSDAYTDNGARASRKVDAQAPIRTSLLDERSDRPAASEYEAQATPIDERNPSSGSGPRTDLLGGFDKQAGIPKTATPTMNTAMKPNCIVIPTRKRTACCRSRGVDISHLTSALSDARHPRRPAKALDSDFQHCALLAEAVGRALFQRVVRRAQCTLISVIFADQPPSNIHVHAFESSVGSPVDSSN